MRRRFRSVPPAPDLPQGYFVFYRANGREFWKAFARVPTFEEAHALELTIDSSMESTIAHAGVLSPEALARAESEILARRHLQAVK